MPGGEIMARILKNTTRIELSRKLSYMEAERDAKRNKLRREFPYNPPRHRLNEISKLSIRINQLAEYINERIATRGRR